MLESGGVVTAGRLALLGLAAIAVSVLFSELVTRNRRARLTAIRYTEPYPSPGSVPTGPIQDVPTIKTSPATTSVRYIKAGEWLKGL